MTKEHLYRVGVRWTGNLGTGTSGYRDYSRAHVIEADGKPALPGSSDPAFRGDPARWNPEEMLVASLATCHMLWYLHLCAVAGVAVVAYADAPVGVMEETADGSGRFLRVVLNPKVTIAAASDPDTAQDLHAAAHRHCFIANSVNFPVEHRATVVVAA
jgi:organic hydroperoxide reductase OsmC/OhrA